MFCFIFGQISFKLADALDLKRRQLLVAVKKENNNYPSCFIEPLLN